MLTPLDRILQKHCGHFASVEELLDATAALEAQLRAERSPDECAQCGTAIGSGTRRKGLCFNCYQARRRARLRRRPSKRTKLPAGAAEPQQRRQTA